MSRPILYTFNLSVWSAAADIARIELGLANEIQSQQVDLIHAENVLPAFLQKAPHGTLPTIIDGSRVYGSTVKVIEYLVQKSGKKVAPRTQLTDLVHGEGVDLGIALFGAQTDEEAKKKAEGLAGFYFSTRVQKMKGFLALPESAPFKAHIEAKIVDAESILAVYHLKAPEEARTQYYATSLANRNAARAMIYETLPSAIAEGPFVGGATPGEDDFHVIAWLIRSALVSGAEKTEQAAESLEKRFGAPLPEQIKKLLAAWEPREGFKSTYAEGKSH
ncbi:hypothetical protein K488DRAFT_86154 [Vararia minispora EC-137]|uniref:Uncharacterized protein n=1 Tax=Vararia minispora EC-137 TaxID=1314806 RepID=A0ACB8QKE5_9AGAM|nr:hypothetical protein K488DRAFT_86154 [Vararia minispora EC-137]